MGLVPRASLLLLGLLAAVGVAAAPAHRTMGPVPRAPLLLLGLLSTVGVAAAAAPTVAPSGLPTPIPSLMPSPVPTALFSGRKKSSSDDYSTAQTVAAGLVTIFAFVIVGILIVNCRAEGPSSRAEGCISCK